jgi:hypothetical protein
VFRAEECAMNKTEAISCYDENRMSFALNEKKFFQNPISALFKIAVAKSSQDLTVHPAKPYKDLPNKEKLSSYVENVFTTVQFFRCLPSASAPIL